MRPNRLQILMVFAVGVLFGGVRGDCGGFGPDLSNLKVWFFSGSRRRPEWRSGKWR